MSDGEYSDEDYEYCYDSDDDDGSPAAGGGDDDPDEDAMDVSSQNGAPDLPVEAGLKLQHTHPSNPSSGEVEICMLPSESLEPVMENLVGEAAEILGAERGAAAILMREHGWDKERLLEGFMDDPEKVQKKCGVLARCNGAGGERFASGGRGGKAVNSSALGRYASKRKHCEICLDEDGFDPSEMIGMPCGHEFCSICWYGYVSNALEKGPLCIRETCPQAGCNELITEGEVREAAPDLLPKFESYQLRSFVETFRMTRWCPGPGCGRVAFARGTGGAVADAGELVARCDECDSRFCFKCGEEPHAPVTCKLLATWQEKCRNESETANWILANTKPCPKCSSRIEKNQGCNHMTCSKCRHEFCWICMGDWAEHGSNTGGYYKCNKFDPNASDGDDQSDAAKAKRELDRYLHYYKRFHGHSQAQDFARKSVRETEARMVLLQEQNSETVWTDVEFLKAANELLVECRRVLKYTYVHAYYLEDVGKRSRFEYHQEMLERFTETLSELSEKPLKEMNRTEVVNQTRVVDRFMKNVLKYVEEGMED